MATDIIFADAADDDVWSNSTTYTTARSGAGLSIQFDGNTCLGAGQTKISTTFYCIEGFVSFDTSIIGTDSISAAVLSMYGNADKTLTDFIERARLYDWGTSVTTADWIAGASLSAQTLLAHFDTTGFVNGAYCDFVDDAMPANVNKSGFTRIVLSSDRHEAGTQPTQNEYTQWVNTNSAAGTATDPKLTVTHAPPAVAGYPFVGGGYFPV